MRSSSEEKVLHQEEEHKARESLLQCRGHAHVRRASVSLKGSVVGSALYLQRQQDIRSPAGSTCVYVHVVPVRYTLSGAGPKYDT